MVDWPWLIYESSLRCVPMSIVNIAQVINQLSRVASGEISLAGVSGCLFRLLCAVFVFVKEDQNC